MNFLGKSGALALEILLTVQELESERHGTILRDILRRIQRGSRSDVNNLEFSHLNLHNLEKPLEDLVQGGYLACAREQFNLTPKGQRELSHQRRNPSELLALSAEMLNLLVSAQNVVDCRSLTMLLRETHSWADEETVLRLVKELTNAGHLQTKFLPGPNAAIDFSTEITLSGRERQARQNSNFNLSVSGGASASRPRGFGLTAKATTPEKLILLGWARESLKEADLCFSTGNFHDCFIHAAAAIGNAERYSGQTAEGHELRDATSARFSLHTMISDGDQPGDLVVQYFEGGPTTEQRAKTALRLASRFVSELDPPEMQVLRLLGKGGYGRVEAVASPDGEVARKTFDPEGLEGQELDNARRRFLREVDAQDRLARSQQQPLVLPVLMRALGGSHPWFTMPLASKSLHDEFYSLRADNINRADLVAASEALILEVLELVERVHVLGLIHRDLKPENFLCWNGNWVLADFGLCLTPGSVSRFTSTARGLGTASYLAPEQYASAKDATAQSDIYSLGCILDDLFGKGNRVPYAQIKCNRGPISRVTGRCTEFEPSLRFGNVPGLTEAFRSAVQEELTG